MAFDPSTAPSRRRSKRNEVSKSGTSYSIKGNSPKDSNQINLMATNITILAVQIYHNRPYSPSAVPTQQPANTVTKPRPVSSTTTSSMASTSSHSEARSNPPSVVRATIQDVCLWALQNSSSDILDIVYPVLVPEYQEKRWALKLCALVNAGIGCQPSASHRVVRLSCERENKRAVAPEELMHGLFARLSQAKDLGSGRGLPELCADFWDNVVKSGIKRLVIVLEKTHRLFDVLRSFEGFATGLLRVPPGPVSEAGVSVKIVVISSCKKAAEELMKKYGHCGESFDD